MRTYIADIGVSEECCSNSRDIEFNTVDELISNVSNLLNSDDVKFSYYYYFYTRIYLKVGEENGEPVYGDDCLEVVYRVDSRNHYVRDEIDAIISKVQNEVTEEKLNKLT